MLTGEKRIHFVADCQMYFAFQPPLFWLSEMYQTTLTVPVTDGKKKKKRQKENMLLTKKILTIPPNFLQTPITLSAHF